MRINLRRGDAGVAEHFLHRAQVARRLQQMRGEGVAQHVRMNVARHAGAQRLASQAHLNCPVTQARPAPADEKGMLVRRRPVARAPPATPPAPRAPGCRPARCAPCCACREHGPRPRAAHLRARRCRAPPVPQGAVPTNRTVRKWPHRERPARDHPRHSVTAMPLPHRPTAPSGAAAATSAAARPRRDWPHEIALAEPGEETAPGRQHAPERTAGQALRVKLGDEAADLVHLQFGQPQRTGQRQQTGQVAPVIADGVR